MKKLFFALLLSVTFANAQTVPKEAVRPNAQGNYDFAEIQPEFPGGQDRMLQYLQENIQYPEIARRAGIEGPVFVQFIVNQDGSISDAMVLRGIGGGCDEEALRVVNAMPKWKPGFVEGKPVRVRHTLQVRFKLRDVNPKPVDATLEIQPEFPGGQAGLLQYLQENIQYPRKAHRRGIQGAVFVQFIVNEDGSISRATVNQGIGGGCDEEALRVVNAMPKWKAGTQGGVPVKVKHTIEIRFKLR